MRSDSGCDLPAGTVDPTGSVLREVGRLAAPLVLASASTTIMGFVDVLLVSRLGSTALAAVMPAGIIVFCFVALASGAASCVNTFVSQSLGKGTRKDCSAYAWQGLFVSTLLGIGVMPLWFAAPRLFRLVGHAPEVQAAEVVYFQVRLWGVGAAVAGWALVAYFQGIHRPWTAFLTTAGANLLNLALDVALIFGKWGFPALGVRGAALATVISGFVQAALLVACLVAPRHARTYGGVDTCRIDWTKLRQLVHIGWPAGVNFFLDIFTWAVFMNLLIGRFGEVQLAGNNLAIQYMHLSFMPTTGLSAAATALMGKYIGRGDYRRAKARAYVCVKIAMVYMTTMGLVFLVFRYPLARAFSQDPEVVHWGALILLFAAFFQTMDAVGIVSSGALRGAGDTHWTALTTVLCSWGVFLPLGWAFARFVPSLGSAGPWIGGTVYIIVIGGLLFRRLASDRWRRIDIFGRVPETTGGPAP